jgi:hypothetical protein
MSHQGTASTLAVAAAIADEYAASICAAAAALSIVGTIFTACAGSAL